MAMILDGSNGLTTPGVVNTAGETIATTLSVTGVTTLTGGLNAALPVLSGGTGVTTKTGTGSVVLNTAPTFSGSVVIDTLKTSTGTLATQNGMTGIAKVWVYFSATGGTMVVNSSFNISSVTRNSAGDYTLNFTTALADTNFCIAGVTEPNATVNYTVYGRTGGVAFPRTVSSVRVFTAYVSSIVGNATTIETSAASIVIFGL